MKVWRVAHNTARDYDGRPVGPYRTSNAPRLTGMYAEHCTSSHLTPMMDPLLCGISMYEVCGFDSLNALRVWFAGWAAELNASGYLVYEYEIAAGHVRVGRNGQAVFLLAKATERKRVTMDLAPVQMAIF